MMLFFCTALRCPCAAETGVTQTATLRGFAAKTDASALAMHLPDAFQVYTYTYTYEYTPPWGGTPEARSVAIKENIKTCQASDV